MPTQFWTFTIGQCEDKEEFEKLLSDNEEYYEDWSTYISGLLLSRHVSAKNIAEGCNISESTAKRIMKTIPSRRENVIKLACILRLDIEQTDILLTRRASFQRLYPKNADDAIWMYILKNGGSAFPDSDFAEMKAMFLKLCEQTASGKPAGSMTEVATGLASSLFAECGDLEQFLFTMYTLIPSFEKGYAKLMEYIERLFVMKGASANTLFNDNTNFLKLHYAQTEALRRHVCPTRTYLLTLGLHLGLTADGINELLETAGMGPICGKDRLEAAIFYLLEELNSVNPDAFFDPSDSFPLFESGMEMPELANDSRFFDGVEVDEDTVSAYIRHKLTEMNIPLDSRIEVSRILELL